MYELLISVGYALLGATVVACGLVIVLRQDDEDR